MNRSTIFLVTLLLVLGAITYFLLPSENERETSYKPVAVSFAVDSASVVKIELQQKSKNVTLENVGGKWSITFPMHYPADPAIVKQLVSGLSNFRIGSLISSNPEKQSLFQVDGAGTKIIVTDRAGKVSSMVVGKMGPSFSEVYIRLPEGKDVYLGEGIDTWTLNKEVKDWRDKSILSTTADAIKELSYSVGSKETSFQRDSMGWKSDSKTLDAATMNPVLNSLSNLHADDFLDTLLKSASHPITLGVRGNENVTLKLYPSLPDSSKYFVQSSATPQIFVVSKWTVQQLLKPVEEQSTKPAAVASRKESNPPAIEAKPPQVVENKKTVKTPDAPPKETASRTPRKDSVAGGLPPKKPVARAEKPRTMPVSPITPPKEESAPSGKTAAPQQPASSSSSADDDGELTVHTVKKGETMTSIAQQYKVSVEQILKWNLLKSISVKPGQELYVYQKK